MQNSARTGVEARENWRNLTSFTETHESSLSFLARRHNNTSRLVIKMASGFTYGTENSSDYFSRVPHNAVIER